MNLINIEHISKIYGEKVIFDDASFGVQQGDKIGIVGINGTGKSTFLKVVAGKEVPDEGQVVRQNGLKIAFVPQNPTFPEGMDIRSYALQDADAESWQVESNLTELGITQWDQKIDTLSGGQKRRVVLAKILAGDFDVLLLDEPTNHLDQEMISWLEDYLRSYRGTVLMVTHDRYFLDRVTNRILELSHGKMYGYDADYSGFLELKAQREEMELASQRKRQSILRMELEWAKRGCRARTTKQKARLERLEALKAGKAPVTDQTVELDSVETRMGKKTIELHHVSKRFGEKKILDDFSYIVLRNQRLGIIGPNGCGKSTILKLLMRFWDTDNGQVSIGGQDIKQIQTKELRNFESFVTQETDIFHDTIAANIGFAKQGATREEIVEAAKKASFHEFVMSLPEGYDTKVGELGDTLSGGEKQRIGISRAFLHDAPLLLMDEPTSNLDSLNEGVILKAVKEEGKDKNKTVVLVSHRKSTMGIADEVVEL